MQIAKESEGGGAKAYVCASSHAGKTSRGSTFVLRLVQIGCATNLAGTPLPKKRVGKTVTFFLRHTKYLRREAGR